MKTPNPLIASLILVGLLVPVAPFTFAYVASSTNYRIQMDSVNSGGLLSTSSSYTVEDTLGESGVGTSSSASYQVKAGYQQMQETYLAVSLSGNVTLLPNIPSVGGGTADGTASWTIVTDNPAGYSMNIRASTSPALASGVNSFANYITVGADPDITFVTPVGTSRFGFTPEGADVVQRYRDNGAVCNAGGLDTALACWDVLSTTPQTFASRALANNPSGTTMSVRFRAVSDAAHVQPSGTYGATTTVTILAL